MKIMIGIEKEKLIIINQITIRSVMSTLHHQPGLPDQKCK